MRKGRSQIPDTSGPLPVMALVALLFAVGCATVAQRGGGPFTVNGAARYEGRKLGGGEITAHRDRPGGPGISVRIGGDGDFLLVLPPGKWYLTGWAQGEAGRSLYSFWAGNPLELHGPIEESVVLPFAAAAPEPAPFRGVGVTGRVTLSGEPAAGVLVGAYLDPVQGFHGPPYTVSAPSAADGSFRIPVQPGTYYLVARRRMGPGPYQGPLLKGDLFGYYQHNPVTVRGYQGVTVNMPVLKVNRRRGSGSLALGRSITLSGRITTVTGRPAAGVRLVLYDQPEMLGRPAFISSPSDSEGRYVLEASRTGRFYAAARSRIGGPPETGELMGFYSVSDDHSLSLNWGDRLDGIDVTVQEVW